MATDLEIKTNTQKFKCRVNGIVIKDGKLLALRMKNNISFCLPGGHVELGEDTRSAVIREMMEEIETEVTITGELAIIESFYKDKNSLATHDLGFFYLVEPKSFDKIPLKNYSTTENDKGEIKTHNFEWIELSKLNETNLLPTHIKEKLANNNLSFEHLIIND